MAKKKEETSGKTTKKSSKKSSVPIINYDEIREEPTPIVELLVNAKASKSLITGFLNYYGLLEDSKKEIATGKIVCDITQSEFDDMMKRYKERKI